MNGTLSFYKCRLSGGETQTLPVVNKFVLLLLHSRPLALLEG